MLSCEHIVLKERLDIGALFFEKGQFWHILGANGSGKTSLLHTLAGLESPDRGTVFFEQSPLLSLSLNHLAQIRCLLEQSYYCPFALSVSELLSFYRLGQDKIAIGPQDLPHELEQCLQLSALWSQPYATLSGGEKQRVQLARCLLQVWPSILQGKAVLLFDEPLAALDIPFQAKLMKLCKSLSGKGNAIVMSCHDINISAKHASHVLLLKAGSVLEQGNVAAVLRLEALNDAFDHSFLETTDINNAQKIFTSA